MDAFTLSPLKLFAVHIEELVDVVVNYGWTTDTRDTVIEEDDRHGLSQLHSTIW